MIVGYVFLVLALGSATVSLWAYSTPSPELHFGVQIVLYVVGKLAAAVFGFLAVLSFLIGAFT